MMEEKVYPIFGDSSIIYIKLHCEKIKSTQTRYIQIFSNIKNIDKNTYYILSEKSSSFNIRDNTLGHMSFDHLNT